MTFDTIEHLRESLAAPAHQVRTPEYIAKMMHDIPQAVSVDRAKFILGRCTDKAVLEFGASGPLTTAIRKVAVRYLGVDRETSEDVVGFDLDDVSLRHQLPAMAMPDVILCGEILEHLANPGCFLDRVRSLYGGIPVIISVPNAFGEIARTHLANGIENVNKDHVAWYSPTTLRTLLLRSGYDIAEFYFYNGEPPTAEGLIVITKG